MNLLQNFHLAIIEYLYSERRAVSLQMFTTRHRNCKLSIVMALSTTFLYVCLAVAWGRLLNKAKTKMSQHAKIKSIQLQSDSHSECSAIIIECHYTYALVSRSVTKKRKRAKRSWNELNGATLTLNLTRTLTLTQLLFAIFNSFSPLVTFWSHWWLMSMTCDLKLQATRRQCPVSRQVASQFSDSSPHLWKLCWCWSVWKETDGDQWGRRLILHNASLRCRWQTRATPMLSAC